MSIVDNSAIQKDRCIPKRHKFINYVLCIFTAFCPLELFSLRGMFKVFCDRCISICPCLSRSSFHVVYGAYIFTTAIVANSDFSPWKSSSSSLLIFFSMNFTFLDFRLRIPTATLFPGTSWTVPKWQAHLLNWPFPGQHENLPVHRLKSCI